MLIVKKPPSMAKKGMSVRLVRFVISSTPTIIAMTKPAPALIPKIPESARGFLVRVCNKTPDMAREAPPSIQAKIRGSLILKTIKDIVVSACPKKT